MERGHQVTPVSRTTRLASGESLGHVIYAIGLTADFREKSFETVDAHVCTLARWLKDAHFDSWLYLSSTRLYGNTLVNGKATEAMPVTVLPGADGLYDISKLMGESLCLSRNSPAVRVARLSNVYGKGQNEHTFLASICKDLRATGSVTIREAPESSKDYIALEDVVALLEAIALSGRRRIYNVASGRAVTHSELAGQLAKIDSYRVTFEHGASRRVFPAIDIAGVIDEFGYKPRLLLDDLDKLLGS